MDIHRLVPKVLALLTLTAVLGAGAGTAAADYRAEVIADEPFAYHRLNETVGDESGSVAMADEAPPGGGTHVNVPTGQMAQAGALSGEAGNLAIRYFDSGTGGDDYSLGPLPAAALEDFSIEFWVKTTQAPAGALFWHEGKGLVDAEVPGVVNDFGVALVSEGRVAFGLGDGVGALGDVQVESFPVDDGVWHHVVAIREGATLRIYLDGALNAQTDEGPTAPRDAVDGDSYQIAGIHGNGAAGELDGSLDEVALYDYALDGDQVCRHYGTVDATAPCLGPPGEEHEPGPHDPTPDPGPTAPPALETTVFGEVDGGGGRGLIFAGGHPICRSSCEWRVPRGSTHQYVAKPRKYARFGSWEGEDCVNTSVSCTLVADKETEEVEPIFHWEPKKLATLISKGSLNAALQIESRLGEQANHAQQTKVKFPPIKLKKRFGKELGEAAGALVTSLPASQARLIGRPGHTLVTDRLFPMLTPRTTTLASLKNPKSTPLVGVRGRKLIGPDGAKLAKVKGERSIARPFARSSAEERHTFFVLGRYAEDLDDSGSYTATFKVTKRGREILETYGEMNLSLKVQGRNPVPLPVTLIEVVQPEDRRGTGGAYTKFNLW